MTTPSGDTAGDWLYAKTAGLSVQTVGGIAMRGTVGVLKDTVDRARPNGIDRGSFPSAHASGTAFYATLASRNLETLHLKPMMTMTADFALGAVTTATAWARIESYQHFPSDVLAGMAGGHFIGAFVTDAFLGLGNPRNALLSIDPLREGAIATMKFNF
jgi:membrane-associated phospholipid phosphatase